MSTDNNKKWHYLFVKRLSALLNGITSSHVGSFYCSNCFYSFRTANPLKKHENVCKKIMTELYRQAYIETYFRRKTYESSIYYVC